MKGCSILVSIALRFLNVLSPFWTTSLRYCDSSPTHNHSGLRSIRAITMAATLPVNSVWTRKTTRLCCLSSCRPGVVLSCQLVVESPVVALPSCPLVTLPSCLLSSPLIVFSLHHPLIVSLHRLVVVALPLVVLPLVALLSRPLVAPLSCPLVSLSLRPPLAV